MSEADSNVVPQVVADDVADEGSQEPKARSRSPSEVAVPALLDQEVGVGETRRRRRSLSRTSGSQPPDGIVSAQVFNLDPERRGRPGSRVRQGTPQPGGSVTPPARNPLDGLDGNPTSPGTESTHEDLRQWSVGRFLLPTA